MQAVASWTAILMITIHSTFLWAVDEESPCPRSEHRQFDFWIGSWEVFDKDENLVGKNQITSVLGGCAIQESWRSTRSSFAGSSFNAFDASRDVWHQTWLDTSGTVLFLDGGLDDDGRMVLQGRRAKRDGPGRVLDRIVWTPEGDGSVRQLWETSEDEGESWKMVFDGLYRRVGDESGT